MGLLYANDELTTIDRLMPGSVVLYQGKRATINYVRRVKRDLWEYRLTTDDGATVRDECPSYAQFRRVAA